MNLFQPQTCSHSALLQLFFQGCYLSPEGNSSLHPHDKYPEPFVQKVPVAGSYFLVVNHGGRFRRTRSRMVWAFMHQCRPLHVLLSLLWVGGPSWRTHL